jgi:hypothetical protein
MTSLALPSPHVIERLTRVGAYEILIGFPRPRLNLLDSFSF